MFGVNVMVYNMTPIKPMRTAVKISELRRRLVLFTTLNSHKQINDHHSVV